MRTSLRLTSVAILFIGACLITSKKVDTAVAMGFNTRHNYGLINLQLDSQSKQVISSDNSESEYEPPNYGGPDSQHGSGTR